MPFTPEQLKHYAAYERVRQSGRFNMFDPRARFATGLNQEQYHFVINNFEALRQQYAMEIAS